MKATSRLALLVAASTAAISIYGSSHSLRADTLTWDPALSGTAAGSEGSGSWDLSTVEWYSANSATDTAWIQASNAVFGNGTSNVLTNDPTTEVYNDVDLAAAITVQDLTLGVGTDGHAYTLSDFGGGHLTVNGNITKNGLGGNPSLLLTSGITLGSGNHTITLHDSPGDSPAELTLNAALSGSGGLVVDNKTYQQYGTVQLNSDSSYAGGTAINKGRLLITTGGGMGTGAVTIGQINAANDGGNTALDGGGALQIGNAAAVAGDFTVSNPITITRNTYGGTGDQFNNYNDALISGNNGDGSRHNVTISNLVVDSTDARISANTSQILLPNAISGGSSPSTSVLTMEGDFAGSINLGGDNSTASTVGAMKINGGVEVYFSDPKNIGVGALGKTLTMSGGTLHIPTSVTSDTQLNIVTSGFGGGFDVPSGQTFTLANSYAGSGLGMRGTGTLNILGAQNFAGGGSSFYDGGVVNVGTNSGATAGQGSLQIGSLHLRSNTFNIYGNVVANNGGSAIGQSQFGTVTGPNTFTSDKGTVNISGNSSLAFKTSTATNDGTENDVGNDVSTAGTINISGNGALSYSGQLFMGRNRAAAGTINQSGGSITATRNGDFTFILGDGRNGNGTILTASSGTYNFSGGNFTSAGEVYAGEGNNSTTIAGVTTKVSGLGNWLQTGGTANINNWIVVGREGGRGTLDISGGSIIHNGGNMSLGDTAAADGGTDIINIHGNAVITDTNGEVWMGNSSGNTTVVTFADTASLTANNWFVVGRGGAFGTLNMTGGSITRIAGQNGGNNNYVGEGSETRSVINLSGGAIAINSGQFFLGNAGSSKGTLNISGTGAFSVANNYLAVGRNGTAQGVINISGGSLTQTGATTPFVIGSGNTASGIVTQTGGTGSADATSIGESGSGQYIASAGSASLGLLNIGQSGTATDSGVLTISGTANVTAGAATFGSSGASTATVNLNGGNFTVASIVAGTGSGARTLNFNGGALTAGSGTTNFVGAKINSVVSTGGAIINVNNFTDSYNSALVHDSTITGVDGGLTVNGPGVLTLNPLVGGTTTPTSNTYTGNTTVASGKLIVASANALPNTTAVSIGATGAMQLGANSTITGLTITSGGQADIAANTLTINYGTGADPVATIRGYIRTGYASSAQTGTGIVSSAAAGSNQYAVGYGDSADGVVSGLATGTLAIKEAFLGDANLDGKVDGVDLSLLATHFGTSTGNSKWDLGDFSYDGNVDGVDLSILATHFGAGTGMSATQSAMVFQADLLADEAQYPNFGNAVPEPMSLSILTLGVGGVMMRRRRA